MLGNWDLKHDEVEVKTRNHSAINAQFNTYLRSNNECSGNARDGGIHINMRSQTT